MELSVILTTHNKGWLISTVVDAIIKYTSTPFELIVVYDGCSDNSQHNVQSVLKTYQKRRGENKIQNYLEVNTPDVHETKANNAGMKVAKSKYSILVQDDMVVDEVGWDTRLIQPMKLWKDVFAVSARNALTHLPGISNLKVIGRIEDDTPRGYYDNADRNLFRIRQSVNRGPLCLDMDKVKELNYLDEVYAPSDCDDADICWRAFLNHGWRCGVYPIDYLSDLNWGTARIKAGLYGLGVQNEQSENYKRDFSQRVWENWCKITRKYGQHFSNVLDEDRIVAW
jgi:glycosyltransferase involved in cell wall biosynthesis